MARTQVLQEIRRMRFEEACGGWQETRPTQEADEARVAELAQGVIVLRVHVSFRSPLTRGRCAF